MESYPLTANQQAGITFRPIVARLSAFEAS